MITWKSQTIVISYKLKLIYVAVLFSSSMRDQIMSGAYIYIASYSYSYCHSNINIDKLGLGAKPGRVQFGNDHEL